MKNVSIIADSTCDLSKELLDKYKIRTFPLHIHLGEKEYLDGINITPEEIFEWSDANKATPKTSTVSPAEAKEMLKRTLAESEQVICFCISSHMSACCSVMRMTAEEMGVEDRVYVIDSANLSTGIGLLILEAAEMASNSSFWIP